jgi:Pyruvate/2-oxoacid:ferredoxin oxidoreductase gamma subunit
MLPVYPLGVKKDVTATREPWPEAAAPIFGPAAVIDAIGRAPESVPRFCSGLPHREWGDDVALKLAGAGGDGAQTAAMIVVRAAINEGFDATHIPSYGPESRGGTSYADVRIAELEVQSPAAPSPHVLVAFNAPSLAKFGPKVVPGGVVVYDSSVAPAPDLPGVRVHAVPLTELANGMGRLMIKNMIALGALAAASDLFPPETFLTAIRQTLEKKPELLALNEQAFALGMRAVTQQP